MTLRLFHDYQPGEVTTIPAGTLRLLLTSIGYRAKARKEIRRKPPMVPRRPPRPCCWTALPGELCRAEPLRPYIPYYNRAAVLTCIASGVAVVSGIGAGRPGAGRRSSVVQAAL